MRASLALAFLLALTVAVYMRHVETASWVYEDSNAIWTHAGVLGLEPIDVTRARWLAATSHRAVFTWISPQPWATHVVNLGLHLVNGILVYTVGLAWLTPPAAVLGAGLFLLSPIQTEAVAYGASRSELLATTCALLALWISGIWPRRWWHVALIVLCVAAAVSAKEMAATVVPLMVIAGLTRGRRLTVVSIGLLALPVIAIAWSVLRFDFTRAAEVSVWRYSAMTAAAVFRYLGLSLVPVGLSMDHDFAATPTVLLVLALFYGGAWLLALVYALWVWRAYGPTVQAVTVGLSWVALEIVPRLLVRTPEILNEHQWYRPLIGLALAGAAVVSAWASRTPLITPTWIPIKE